MLLKSSAQIRSIALAHVSEVEEEKDSTSSTSLIGILFFFLLGPNIFLSFILPVLI